MRTKVVEIAFAMMAAMIVATPAASATEIRVTYAPANFANMYDALAKAFERKYPDIQVKLQGSADYVQLSQQTLRSGITGDLPDISHEGLSYIRIYADRNFAVPLDDFTKADPEWAGLGLAKSISDVGTVNGKTYAVPFSISTMVLFYNLDLLKKAGADPDHLPKDWDEVIALAKKIKASGEDISGVYFDYGANSALAFETLLFSRGGKMMNADETDIAFDGPEGQWAMNLIAQFGKAGQIDMNRNNARQSFTAGKLGIYQNTSSNMGNFDKQIGTSFSYAVTPVPLAEGGRTPAAGNGMMMFASKPEQQEAALKYIKFAAGPEGQAIMARMTGYVPVNHKVTEDGEMKAFYEANPRYAVPLTQIDSLTAWYAFPGANSEKITRDITDEMQEVITLRKPPEAGLAAAAEKARAWLKK